MYQPYLEPFHRYSAHSIELGQRASARWLDCLTQVFQSNFVLGKTLLKAGSDRLNQSRPEASLLWQGPFADPSLEASFQHWAKQHIERGGELAQLLRQCFIHQCQIWNEATAQWVKPNEGEPDRNVEAAAVTETFADAKPESAPRAKRRTASKPETVEVSSPKSSKKKRAARKPT